VSLGWSALALALAGYALGSIPFGLFVAGALKGVDVRLAAVVGHVAPFTLGFRGGKGVATGLGVLGVLVPAAALAGVVAYALLFALTRISSLGSLAAGPAALAASAAWPGTRLSVGFTAILYALILWTHRGNIRRLLARAETRL
jgi:glycerol-3-phosphate acyltransferase PlsY